MGEHVVFGIALFEQHVEKRPGIDDGAHFNVRVDCVHHRLQLLLAQGNAGLDGHSVVSMFRHALDAQRLQG